MKYILRILFLGVFTTIVFGFTVKGNLAYKSDVIIGSGVLTLFFVLMPLFIYHSWKGKKVSDYLLNKDTLKKMNEKD